MVYLLHFERPYFHARHYIGFTDDLDRRLHQHLNGHEKGSPLVRAVLKAGITVQLAATFEGGKDLEKKMKSRHNAAHFCPICKQGG